MAAKKKPSTSDLLYQANALQERTDCEVLGLQARIRELESLCRRIINYNGDPTSVRIAPKAFLPQLTESE